MDVLMVRVSFGRYLQEETDEFQRMVVIRSLLAGTAAVLSAGLVSDFLRSLTPASALPRFASAGIFGVGFVMTQLVQSLKIRPEADDEEPAA